MPSESSSSDEAERSERCEACGHHVDDHGNHDRHCVWALCRCERLSGGGPFGLEVKEPHEHGRGSQEPRPTIGDNVEASYCACGASKARTRDPEPPAPGSSPRPPYAVAYAVQGGALYEVALPGDATATAEGGRLVITHAGMPVTGIVRITPMRTEEGA